MFKMKGWGDGVKGVLNNVKKLQNWYSGASLIAKLHDIVRVVVDSL